MADEEVDHARVIWEVVCIIVALVLFGLLMSCGGERRYYDSPVVECFETGGKVVFVRGRNMTKATACHCAKPINKLRWPCREIG